MSDYVTPETRQKAIDALAEKGAWCGVCELRYDCKTCREVRCDYVDAIAPVLLAPLIQELAALRQERDEAVTVYADACRELTTTKIERDAAEAQLAAAREDTKRLDYLDSQTVTERRCVTLHGNPPRGLRETHWWRLHRNGIGYAPEAETVRGAIDAALGGSNG